MTDRERLESNGWKLVRLNVKRGDSTFNAWTHKDHQPSRRGFFTTADAIDHQRRIDKGHRCGCVPEEYRLHD